MLNKIKLLTFAVFFHATLSWAVPMDYSFEVNWRPFTGPDYSSTVFVTLDGLTGTGNEVFNLNDPLPGRLVSFTVNVAGVDFSESDDARTFLGRPWLDFTDGVLNTIYVRLMSPGGEIVFFNYGCEFCAITADYRPLIVDETATGSIDSRSWAPIDDSTVPAPATLALFGLGLVGLGFNRRKRQTHG